MPAYVQLPTPAAITAASANVTQDLDALVTAALAAAGEAAPAGGSYAEVVVVVANAGSADAYLAHPSDIPGSPESAPTTAQVIPSGTTLEDALAFGPYRYGSLPRLRLLDGASCLVTFVFGRA
jgi:hypothetical protein